MNSSFLYRAFGLYSHECTRIEYKGNTIILHVQSAMNAPLNKAYYLKESLREIWTQINKEEAEKVLLDWVQQAQDSGVKQLKTMANTIMAYKTGILAWYDNHLSTAKIQREMEFLQIILVFYQKKFS
jgi:hypothetical protein